MEGQLMAPRGAGDLARSTTIPPPVGGWNARDPLDAMNADEAVVLENFFPGFGDCFLRKGYRTHATGVGSGAVQTLAELALENGSRKLLAAGGGELYDATTFNAAATSIASGFSVNKWQTATFKNTMFLVNGTDAPQDWDGGASTNATAWTGPTIANLINVSVYNRRLYFVENATLSVWYGGAGSIAGALTELDLSDVFTRGGKLLFAGSWTNDTGSGLQDLFIAVSDMGEMLVYAGSYPGGSDWAKVGRVVLPGAPLGLRSLVDINGDAAIITELGIIPISSLLGAPTIRGEEANFNDRIRDAFRAAAKSFGSNFGWEAMVYPRGHMAIVNVPISEDVTAKQFVVNSETGAWCCFTGIPAICWSLLSEKPYFGSSGGVVYEFDQTYADNGQYIQLKVKQAFNYLKQRDSIKTLSLAKPIFKGEKSVRFLFGADSDFSDDELSGTISITGNLGEDWDVALWDVAMWDSANSYVDDWYTVGSVGRSHALKYEGGFINAPFALAGIQVVFDEGGVI